MKQEPKRDWRQTIVRNWLDDTAGWLAEHVQPPADWPPAEHGRFLRELASLLSDIEAVKCHVAAFDRFADDQVVSLPAGYLRILLWDILDVVQRASLYRFHTFRVSHDRKVFFRELSRLSRNRKESDHWQKVRDQIWKPHPKWGASLAMAEAKRVLGPLPIQEDSWARMYRRKKARWMLGADT